MFHSSTPTSLLVPLRFPRTRHPHSSYPPLTRKLSLRPISELQVAAATALSSSLRPPLSPQPDRLPPTSLSSSSSLSLPPHSASLSSAAAVCALSTLIKTLLRLSMLLVLSAARRSSTSKLAPGSSSRLSLSLVRAALRSQTIDSSAHLTLPLKWANFRVSVQITFVSHVGRPRPYTDRLLFSDDIRSLVHLQ